jgi:hypothetical protein
MKKLLLILMLLFLGLSGVQAQHWGRGGSWGGGHHHWRGDGHSWGHRGSWNRGWNRRVWVGNRGYWGGWGYGGYYPGYYGYGYYPGYYGGGYGYGGCGYGY